jgi:hypothetical protein
LEALKISWQQKTASGEEITECGFLLPAGF